MLMKQVLLLIISILFTSVALHAQDYTFEYLDGQSKTFQLDDQGAQDEVIKGVLRNQTSEDIDIRWVRETVYIHSGWQSAICDPVRCYLPHVDEASFVLPANDTAVLDAHLYPMQMEGDSAVLRVHVINESSGNDTMVIPYRFYQEQASSVQTQEAADVILYPNPASTYFKVRSEVAIGSVEVYDILGKQIKIVKTNATTAHVDVLDLMKGIYIVRIKDNRGNTLKTQRLRKELP